MINALSPSFRKLLSLILVAFLFSPAYAASYRQGDGTFTDTGRGLVWSQTRHIPSAPACSEAWF